MDAEKVFDRKQHFVIKTFNKHNLIKVILYIYLRYKKGIIYNINKRYI